VEVTNDSNEDQKDVLLTLSFEGVGHIISSQGYVHGVLGAIPFDPAYTALYHGANQQLAAILNTYVVHKIPVFNRRQKATFNLLVVRDDASTPIIQASCNHAGVKLEYVPPGLELDGVPLNLATGTGVIVTATTMFLLLRYLEQHHPHGAALIAWIIGFFSGRIGAATVKIWKGLARILG
jgi:hypothetical protein